MNGTPKKTSVAMLWIIHLAFINAIVVYAVITPLFLAPAVQADARDPKLATMLLAILGGLSAFQIVAAFVADRKLAGPAPAAGSGVTAEAYLARAQVRVILVDALYESIAIYGVIGPFLGFTLTQSFMFMGVSLFFLLTRIATLRDITDTAGQLRRSEGKG